jgi:hypothetical protein
VNACADPGVRERRRLGGSRPVGCPSDAHVTASASCLSFSRVCSDHIVTSGYSATPQVRKLGIKAGMRVGLEGAPRGWRFVDPPAVERVKDGPTDVLLWFVRRAADLAEVEPLAARVYPDGALWVVWPRKAAGHVSDVTEHGIRAAVLPFGLVDVKVAAIDDDWSGLKIVWRRETRHADKR